MELFIVLGLLALSVVLFATEKLPVDVITLLLLLVLIGTGILTPAEAFSGFSNEIIIILGSIFVVSGALQETGLLDAIGQKLVKTAFHGFGRFLFLIMVMTAGISAFMNNTVVTAMLMPAVIAVAAKTGINVSKLLMPLAYASILGGTCTLIGTSTNVAVSGYIAKSHLAPLTLFEITPIGLIIVAVGILYFVTVGKRLLPDRKEIESRASILREYLCEIRVLANSPLIDQRSSEWELSIVGFRALKIIRGEETIPLSEATIQEGDLLLVEGKVEDLIKIKKIEGFEIEAAFDPKDTILKNADFKMAEVLLMPRCDLLGQTLKEVDFKQRYGLTPLAIYRHGESLHEKVNSVPLEVGDILLVDGPEERVNALGLDSSLLVLGEHRKPKQQTLKGLYTAGIFLIAVIVGGLNLLPLSFSFLAAALLSILIRSISPEKGRDSIDLRLLILIGGMTAFGTAMEKTGAADFLAHQIVGWLSPFGIMAVLAGFFVVTILLTQPMSNAAAVLVILPVAMSAARELGAQERTFAIGVMLAASVSFITPFEPSCILVYGPGKYKFRDFVKVGGGLTLILIPIVLYLIPFFWRLY